MSYRLDFWLNTVVAFATEMGIAWFLWQAMFRESGKTQIAGFDLQAMVLYYLTVILIGRIIRGRQFEGAISHDIYEGGLNRYLVFPVAYLPFKYAQRLGGLAPALVQVVLFGTLAPLVLVISPELRPTAVTFGMAVGAVMVSHLLHFLIDATIHLVAFWADNVWSLDVANWFVTSLLGGFMVPLAVFPEWAQEGLRWLPFHLFFDFPARVLMGQVSVAEWGRGIGLALVWSAIVLACQRLVWRRGRLKYTGVGI